MAQETILVVDADEKSQKLLEVSFKKEGYDVLLTETIKDAIKTIGARTPDLIICDTDLPDGDGFTLCEQLKRNPNFASIPFLFLTEDEELSRKMKAFELGAAEYLTKPIFIKDVTSRVLLQLQERNKARLHNADDEEVVTGSLDEITVIDLLQTIESRDRSGMLNLEREEGISAEISFHKGNILDAHCGPLRGEEAVYRIMLWPKGSFSLEYKEVESADHIEKDSSALLIEGMRRFESWNDMIGTLPHLSRHFQAVDDVSSVGLPQEVEGLVELFDGTRSLRHIVDQSPLDDLTTLRIIRKLLDEALIEDVTPDNSSMRQSAQHTNLASWLNERTVRDEQDDQGTTRRRARLFDTTPGFKSVPGLNADSLVESEAQIKEVARTLDEISSPPHPGGLEPGKPPGADATEEEITHWRFHWDQEAGQAVATPRERPVDPFALNELEHDLQRIEQMRREEEARRIAAEREFAATHQPPAKAPKPSSSTTPEPTKEPRDVTKDMHRKSVLAEVERRKQAGDKDPRKGIEDLIDRVEQKPESFAEKVAQDYADGEDEHFISRQRTDQFIPVLDAPVSQDEIETAEIDRVEDAEVALADAATSNPLIPLGAPEDLHDEPTVSEEAAQAYKDGVSLEEQALEDQDTGDEEREVEELGDEDSDIDLEEVFPEEDLSTDSEVEDADDATSTPPSQAEDIIAHRTPRNQELVHAEVELKRGSEDTPDEDLTEDDKAEDDKEEASTEDVEPPVEDEDDSATLAAVSTEDDEDDVKEEPDEPSTDVEEPEDEPEEEEEESYLLEAPLFVDEEEGFNKAGLFGVIVVIAALVAVIFFVLDGDEKPKKPKTDPLVVAVVDAAPDLQVAEQDAAPDMALAAIDMPTDMAVALIVREISPENAPEMGALFGNHTYGQTASMVLTLNGKDMSQVTSPVATLLGLDMGVADMGATDMGVADMSKSDAAPDMAKQAPDAPADIVATNDPKDPVKVDPPKKDPPVQDSPKTVDEQLKEVANLVRREKYKSALKPARKLVKEDPKNGKAAGLLGSAELNGANDSGAAIKNFERAQSLGYRSSTMYLDMATAYQLSGKRDKARKAYEKFLKAYPKHKMAKDVESILNNQF